MTTVDARHTHTASPAADVMLEVDDVVVSFGTDRGTITPVDHVRLRIGAGETLGLVGESGCGKSTLGRAILQLVPQRGGEVRLDGKRLTGLSTKALRPLRKHLQVIFQDPRGSLDPQMRIRDIIAEPLVVHGMAGDRDDVRRRVDEMLVNVGLDPALGDRRPGQLSGGSSSASALHAR